MTTPTDECVSTFRLHDVALLLDAEPGAADSTLTRVLDDLSFVRTSVVAGSRPAVTLSVRRRLRLELQPLASRHRSRGAASEPQRLEMAADGSLRLGRSRIHVRSTRHAAHAEIDESFASYPVLKRQQFWTAGLVLLLRHEGFFALHGAGVSTPRGNLLFVGPSGHGKSTLALGLVQHGCGYLSDDAVLLCRAAAGVRALALRRPFSIDAAAAHRYGEVPMGPPRSIRAMTIKRRADVRVTYPRQYVEACRPDVIVFPRVAASSHTTIAPVPRTAALGRLLAQSGPQLFDRDAMRAHLTVLVDLVRQAPTYDLRAGADLLDRPMKVLDLIAAAGDARGPIDPRADQSV